MDREALELLACPWCVRRPEPPPAGIPKGALELLGSHDRPEALRCRQCGRLYRFLDGVPNLLLDEAKLPGE